MLVSASLLATVPAAAASASSGLGAVVASGSFVDVPAGAPFFDDIEWLAQTGISTGTAMGDGTYQFRPAEPVRREAMAAFLYRFAGRPTFSPPEASPFVDVATDASFYKEIAWLADQGISTGTALGDGTFQFRPSEAVSREAMAAFLYRFMGRPAFEIPTVSPFVDVATDASFYAEISWLAANHISNGTDLGDGTFAFRPAEPVRREAMAAFLHRTDPLVARIGYIQVSAGAEHSLALAEDGLVYAWGLNASGQLGDGTTVDRNVPTQVTGLSSIVAVSAGADHSVVANDGTVFAGHSLALASDGTVYAWGDNASGQVGDGTVVDRLTATQVPDLTGIVAISAGGNHSLAVAADGTVYAWGSNTYGEIGDGTTTDRLVPTKVPGLSGIVSVGGGFGHSLALSDTGVLYAWGLNNAGQLGDGTTTDRLQPVSVSVPGNVVGISTGFFHTLAMTASGAVYAWGFNGLGQLGDGTTIDRSAPTLVPGLSGVVAIGAGFAHSLAVTSTGSVFAWGDNSLNQLGDGTGIGHLSPTQVPGLTGALGVSAGYLHSLAVTGAGVIYTWGDNTYGQLGGGTTG